MGPFSGGENYIYSFLHPMSRSNSRLHSGGAYHPREQTGSNESWSSLYIYLKGQCTNNDMSTIIFCQRHYKVKFDLDPGYIFQTGLTISLS